MTITKYVTFDEENIKHIQYVRNTVFTGEQNVDSDIDFDGNDSHAIHVIIFNNEEPIATGRMLKDGHIGRVAVISAHRGLGIGAQIIKAFEHYAREENYPRLYLGSQLHAKSFYSKLGFTVFGQQYTEADIEHISMEKAL